MSEIVRIYIEEQRQELTKYLIQLEDAIAREENKLASMNEDKSQQMITLKELNDALEKLK